MNSKSIGLVSHLPPLQINPSVLWYSSVQQGWNSVNCKFRWPTLSPLKSHRGWLPDMLRGTALFNPSDSFEGEFRRAWGGQGCRAAGLH